MICCCDQFIELEEMDSSLRHDDRGWILVTDEATEVVLGYCPFCGRHIGIGDDE